MVSTLLLVICMSSSVVVYVSAAGQLLQSLRIPLALHGDPGLSAVVRLVAVDLDTPRRVCECRSRSGCLVGEPGEGAGAITRIALSTGGPAAPRQKSRLGGRRVGRLAHAFATSGPVAADCIGGCRQS